MNAIRDGRDAVQVLVCGGGPVGSALALALGQSGARVALVEPSAAARGSHAADLRPIALAASSVRILETLGVWPALAPGACPIRTVHVSERGRFGMVRLRAEEQGVEALGHVTDAASIQEALDSALSSIACVERLRAAVDDARVGADSVEVALRADEPLAIEARLAVAADGAQSPLRRLMGVGAHRREYRQAAVVCNVTPGRPHANVAYERFTAAGPVALLPLRDGRCGLVWTLPEVQAEVACELGEEDFLGALQDAFGYRLGRLVAATPRAGFPLSLVRSAALNAPRCAFVGNAANQLHPVAGQGLNLGLRDVAALAERVMGAVRRGEDPGSERVLERYARDRQGDQRAVVLLTDVLARGFGAGASALGAVRSAGMIGLDLIPAASRAFARRAMGLAGRQPRMVRGLAP